jgi:hypothetical protein
MHNVRITMISMWNNFKAIKPLSTYLRNITRASIVLAQMMTITRSQEELAQYKKS